MSLRKSACLTPELLAAARSNSQYSTGPRTPAGKCNSRLNALKHGERADPDNHYEVMRALGEDPQAFENLKQELAASFGPREDALFEKQIDDLARLYWRRNRIERAQTGLMRRALLGVEEWQHRRQVEIAGATFDATQAIDIELPLPSDPGARLRLLLSFLGVIREQVKERAFLPWHAPELENLYQKKEGWRQARLCRLLRLLSEPVEPEESPGEEIEPGQQQARELEYQELLQLLKEEIAGVEEEFEYTEKVNEEKAAIERDACLAPAGEEWRMLLRREEALDRSIDRKIKLLLSLRKESERKPPPAPMPESDDHEDEVPVGAALVASRDNHPGCPDPEQGSADLPDRSAALSQDNGQAADLRSRSALRF